MIYKNIDIHNAAELIPCGDGGVTWSRVPLELREKLDGDGGKQQVLNSTGVELRFAVIGESVTLRLKAIEHCKGLSSIFHIFRGGIQGSWEDHELNNSIGCETTDVVIKRSANLDTLTRMSKLSNTSFAPEIVRVIFDRGYYEIVDIIGDVVPPKAEQLPSKTVLFYGSSITHGSNSIDTSHSYTALTSRALDFDTLNLAMAGNCRMEPAMADHIAALGVGGAWDIAVMELGINVLSWGDDLIDERASYMIRRVASENPDKPIAVISPLYCCDDFNDNGKNANRWRSALERIVKREALKNVTYISGLELLGDMSLISADEVHPNIYGAWQIAERLVPRLKQILH